jgi:predicted nucleic acid-binding protein
MEPLLTGKLLDSTILVDLMRGSVVASKYVDEERAAGTLLFISVISAMELIAGCRNSEEVAKVNKLTAEFTLLQLSSTASAMAHEFMLQFNKSHGLAIPDALIAATAAANNLELISDNVRHFAMIPNLPLQRPY